jgi:hypothetical protein
LSPQILEPKGVTGKFFWNKELAGVFLIRLGATVERRGIAITIVTVTEGFSGGWMGLYSF